MIFFWLSLALVFHTYVVYPNWMLVRARKYKSRQDDFPEWPSLVVLVAAYNEEAVIANKITNALQSHYPADKLRIIVGSDRSSDATDSIVRSFAEKDPRVELVSFTERTGKPQIINTLVERCSDSILVLCDADTLFEADTLSELVRPFANPKVGGVQANFLSRTPAVSDVSRQELQYTQREADIKKGQSVDGCVIGAFGACYAMRRELYRPVPKGFLVDDFYLFMKVLEQGYQTVFAETAVCDLEISGESKTEFKRKMRIGTGNFQNFAALRSFLNPFKDRASGYYWSHKVLRWFTPFLLLVILLSNLFLAGGSSFFYGFLVLQVLGYTAILIDLLLKAAGIHTGVLRYASHFFMMNMALLAGFFRYLKGGNNGTWK